MSDKNPLFDGKEFAIELDPDNGTLHILWRSEVFASISIPVLAACAQEIMKRIAANAKNGGRH
jgi:hypothetical protein